MTEFGNTIFHEYAKGNIDFIPEKKYREEALLIRNTFLETPFMTGLKNGASNTRLRLLLNEKVVNVPDFWGRYPIYYAKKDLDLYQMMVNAQLDFNLEDSDGLNALDVISLKAMSMPELVYANEIILRHMNNNLERVRLTSPSLALMIERESLVIGNNF